MTAMGGESRRSRTPRPLTSSSTQAADFFRRFSYTRAVTLERTTSTSMARPSDALTGAAGQLPSESLLFYHTDHLGTPIVMTNGAGALAWKAEYRPFGDLWTLPASSVANNLRFPGQYFDEETELHQNWFRTYEPPVGRYREGDPVGLETDLNIYGYAGQNPLMGADPTGTTWRSNRRFLYEWWFEHGDPRRTYGVTDVETQELQSSKAAAYMRKLFRAGDCRNIRFENYGTLRGYWDTGLRPWEWDSTATQIGGFVWSATNMPNGQVRFRVYNTASLNSFFLHIPMVPRRPRNPDNDWSRGGNIEQKFEWVEDSPCAEGCRVNY